MSGKAKAEVALPVVAASELVDGLPEDVRERFLEALRADKLLGNRAALRAAGVTGKRSELNALLDEELLDDARRARGWNVLAVEDVIWEVALDKEHPQWERAAARIVKAYGGPQFRDQLAVEHGGQVEVESPDVTAAIERFTGTIQRLAERAVAESGGAVRAVEPGRPALPVAEPGG